MDVWDYKLRGVSVKVFCKMRLRSHIAFLFLASFVQEGKRLQRKKKTVKREKRKRENRKEEKKQKKTHEEK